MLCEVIKCAVIKTDILIGEGNIIVRYFINFNNLFQVNGISIMGLGK